MITNNMIQLKRRKLHSHFDTILHQIGLYEREDYNHHETYSSILLRTSRIERRNERSLVLVCKSLGNNSSSNTITKCDYVCKASKTRLGKIVVQRLNSFHSEQCKFAQCGRIVRSKVDTDYINEQRIIDMQANANTITTASDTIISTSTPPDTIIIIIIAVII